MNNLNPKKDPNGLTKLDIEILRAHFKNKPITPKMTIEEIQFQAGQTAVIDFIETQMIGGQIRDNFIESKRMDPSKHV